MPKIWGVTLVKNEDRYLWFAVSSVINYLDKVLIWDTGSTDQTVKVIKELQKKYPNKIEFREYGEVDEERFTKARQEMLDLTKSDWFLVLDGDEVWWEASIKKIWEVIGKSGDKYNLIFNPTINLIGDIYHFQEEAAGQYEILDKKGHYNVRAINRKIEGLHVKRPYGEEGYYNKEEILIQKTDLERILFVDAPYMHFTHLNRSSNKLEVMQRSGKRKYELGITFPKDYKYPEVFYQKYPDFVSSPWKKRPTSFIVRAAIETPLKQLKRRIKR